MRRQRKGVLLDFYQAQKGKWFIIRPNVGQAAGGVGRMCLAGLLLCGNLTIEALGFLIVYCEWINIHSFYSFESCAFLL